MTAEEVNVLGHSLAFEHCVSSIETNCLRVDPAETDWEFDFFDVTLRNEENSEWLPGVLSYLEARGLVERHAKNQGWIRILDESEACQHQEQRAGDNIVCTKCGVTLRKVMVRGFAQSLGA